METQAELRMERRWVSRHGAHVWFAAVLAAGVLLNLWWVSTNQRPPDWDQSQYLLGTLRLSRSISQGWPSLLEAARGMPPARAPGLSLLSMPFMLVLGEGWTAPVYANVLLWAAGAIYLFLLARRWLSPTGSLIAGLLAAAMPLALALARSYFVEASLTAVVVAFLYHAEASDYLSTRRHLLALILWGAVGMLIKVTFPSYVVLPALAGSLTGPSRRRGRAAIMGSWALVALASCAIAWWIWYGRNWQAALEFARSSGFGAIGSLYRRASLSDYLMQLTTHGTSWWPLVALGVLLAMCFRRKPKIDGRLVVRCVAWAVPPMLAMILAENGEIRFAGPYLPALALVVAALVDGMGWPDERARALAAAVAVAPPWVMTGLYSTGLVPGLGDDWWVAQGVWYGRYQRPPNPGGWPLGAIVNVAGVTAGGSSEPERFAVNVSSPEVNADNLAVAAALSNVPVEVFDLPPEPLDRRLRAAFASQLLLTLDGGHQQPNFINVHADAVNEALRSGALPFTLVGEFDAPGGWRLGEYRRICPRLHAVDGVGPLATAEGGVKLTAVGLGYAWGHLRVGVSWAGSEGSSRSVALFVEARSVAGELRGGYIPPPCASGPAPAGGDAVQLDFLIDAESLLGDYLMFGFVERGTGRLLPLKADSGVLTLDSSSTRIVVPAAAAIEAARAGR